MRELRVATGVEQVGVGDGQPELSQVRVAEPGRGGPATESCLEHQRGGRDLTEILARAGLDQPELHELLRVRLCFQRLLHQPESVLRSAQGALAVGEHRAVALVPAHPGIGTQLACGFREVTSVVRRDPDRLADETQPGRSVPRRPGVLECQLGVVLEQAAGGDEVPPDGIRVARVEAAQGGAHRLVELTRVRPVGQRRTVRTARRRLLPVRTALMSRGTPSRSLGRATGAIRTAVLPRRTVPLGAVPLGAVATGATVLRLTTRTTGRLRPVTGRAPVLPRRTITLRAIATGTAVLPRRTRTTGRLGAIAPGTAVLPRRTITLRAVPLRAVTTGTTVLPFTAGATRALRTVARRATVLPAGSVTLRAIALGSLPAGTTVLPRRAATLGAVTGGPAVLRLTSRTPGRLRPLATGTTVLPARTVTLRTVTLRAVTLRTVTLRAITLRTCTPLRAVPLRAVARGPAPPLAPSGSPLGPVTLVTGRTVT
jgi:hypothetical protein